MRFSRSFYARLSSIFLLLVLALGAGTLVIAFNAAGHLSDEVEQLLNREYAANIADEIRPLVSDTFSEDVIKGAIHYMMVLNPMVEIYLLDADGNVVSYFAGPDETIERFSIDLDPVRELIRTGGNTLILGDDPRNSDAMKPFSAAELTMGSEEGYVYVILRGDRYDRSFAALRNSYYLKTGFYTFLFAVFATLVVGLLLFSLLTRKLRALSQAVKAFESGEYDRRVDVTGADEVGALGRAFNEMAASLESGVEKLKEAERQRSELIANISHDLRGPLTSIRGNLETVILKDSRIDSNERRALLELSLKNVASFQDLVEDLFELAKLESRQSEPVLEQFQLAELVQDVVLKLKKQADDAGISLFLDPPGELFPIQADIGMIERVLTNLIENALRFTPPGGTIRVTLRRTGARSGDADTAAGAGRSDRAGVGESDGVVTTVTDTGPGIADEDLPHIFERFYRADKSRNRAIPGTGLGLAIAKEIVDLHGGRIEAQSRPGEGARITFYLYRDEVGRTNPA